MPWFLSMSTYFAYKMPRQNLAVGNFEVGEGIFNLASDMKVLTPNTLDGQRIDPNVLI
jgi:hypothetical protein